jgi:hypothetical protein
LATLAAFSLDEQAQKEEEAEKQSWLKRLFKIRPEGEN